MKIFTVFVNVYVYVGFSVKPDHFIFFDFFPHRIKKWIKNFERIIFLKCRRRFLVFGFSLVFSDNSQLKVAPHLFRLLVMTVHRGDCSQIAPNRLFV